MRISTTEKNHLTARETDDDNFSRAFEMANQLPTCNSL